MRWTAEACQGLRTQYPQAPIDCSTGARLRRRRAKAQRTQPLERVLPLSRDDCRTSSIQAAPLQRIGKAELITARLDIASFQYWPERMDDGVVVYPLVHLKSISKPRVQAFIRPTLAMRIPSHRSLSTRVAVIDGNSNIRSSSSTMLSSHQPVLR